MGEGGLMDAGSERVTELADILLSSAPRFQSKVLTIPDNHKLTFSFELRTEKERKKILFSLFSSLLSLSL